MACLFILVALAPNGPFSDALKWVAEWQPLIVSYGGGALIAVGAGWFVFLLMLLKSFIWNIYQAILLTIATTSLPKEEIDEIIMNARHNAPKNQPEIT